MVNGELGNLNEAIVQYAEALCIARREGDLESAGIVINNLGCALNYAGLYLEAIPCFTRVIAVAQPGWTFRADRNALSNLAQSHYYLEDFPQALTAIERCLALTSPSSATGHFEQTIREFMFVQIALEMQLLDLARTHAALCRQHSAASNSRRCKIMADIATARCEIRDGNSANGLLVLENALEESRSFDSSHTDALVAIIKGYDEAGQLEAALGHMERLLQQMTERGTRCVQGLLALRAPNIVDVALSDAKSNLRSLEHRHTNLRARVAERNAARVRAEMLERLAVTADLKEDASGEHGYRVGRLSALLASKIGWPDEAARSLELAARLHDIGKIGIPDRILGSSQALKDAERRLMEAHAGIGAELLAKSDVPQLRMAEDIARHHHEWWDGTGYPDRLGGNRIPLHARIVALADVFDALTHGRPFSAPWTADEALAEIRARCGTQFDPRLCDRFLELVGQLRAEHADLDSHLAIAGRNSPFRHARQKIRDMLDPAYACGFDVSVATSQTRH